MQHTTIFFFFSFFVRYVFSLFLFCSLKNVNIEPSTIPPQSLTTIAKLQGQICKHATLTNQSFERDFTTDHFPLPLKPCMSQEIILSSMGKQLIPSPSPPSGNLLFLLLLLPSCFIMDISFFNSLLFLSSMLSSLQK